MSINRAVPVDIKVRRASRLVEVEFAGGVRFTLPAEYLRVESPSAEVQGHSPDQRVTVAGKQDVGIKAVEPIGHYAIRIQFDDGHDTGIYTWDYLMQLGQEHAQRWQDYLNRLASKGLSRERAPR